MTKTYWICISSALFFVFGFIQMAMMNTTGPALIQEAHLSIYQYGFLLSSFFYGNAIFLIIAGMILDRCSIRTTLLCVSAISVMASLIFAITHSFPILFIMRFIIGAAHAFALLASLKLASHLIPSKRIGLVVGAYVMMGMFGAMFAQAPLFKILNTIGLRNTYLMVSILGVIFWYLIFSFLKTSTSKDRTPHISTLSKRTILIKSICNKQNWFIGIYIALINLTLSIFGESWGIILLKSLTHFSAFYASIASTIAFLGVAFGSPLLGIISDRIKSRKLPIIGALFILAFTLILLTLGNIQSIALLLLLMLLIGLCNGAQSVGFVHMVESNDPIYNATAMSFVSIIIMLSSGLAQPIFAHIFSQHNTWFLSFNNAQVAILLLILGLCIALITSGFSKETIITKVKQVPDN